jgi:hypothetical protein
VSIDARLARQKLDKKNYPDHGGRQRHTVTMAVPHWLRGNQQSASMMAQQVYVVKAKYYYQFNYLLLIKGAAHRRCPLNTTAKLLPPPCPD